MKNGECEVSVVEHPEGIVQGCKVCREVLVKGNFAIGIHVRENGSNFKYFLGVSPQPEHCGEQKKFIQTFITETEAEAEKLKVLAYLSEKGTTEGLPLIGFFDPKLN
jgi:hypothetical protein